MIVDLDTLSTRLTQQYGSRLPFVGAGMGFVAHERLAAAVGHHNLPAARWPAKSLPI